MMSPASDETQDGEKDGEKGIIKKQQGKDESAEFFYQRESLNINKEYKEE